MELNFYTPQNRVWKWKKNILRMAEKMWRHKLADPVLG